MRIILLALFTSTSLGLEGKTCHLPYRNAPEFTTATRLEDGWYEADVKYRNYNPLYYSQGPSYYKLKVAVQSNKVVAIDFGNGGSIHAGPNNEGYDYSGGEIRIILTSAFASVQINDGRYIKTYEISLKL